MAKLADSYEQRYPGVEIPSAQKEEREQRERFKAERHSHRRTGRTSGIVVPPLPWQRKDGEDA